MSQWSPKLSDNLVETKQVILHTKPGKKNILEKKPLCSSRFECKAQFTAKIKWYHYLFTLVSWKTCMTYFFPGNTKGVIYSRMSFVVALSHTVKVYGDHSSSRQNVQRVTETSANPSHRTFTLLQKISKITHMLLGLLLWWFYYIFLKVPGPNPLSLWKRAAWSSC